MFRMLPKVYFRAQVSHYVLFLVGRVGSTYLTSLLNSHGEIQALGEKSRDLRDFDAESQLKVAKELLTPPLLGKYQVTGFNAKLVHIKDLDGFAQILQQAKCKIIHLKRENRVKAVVSYLNGKRLAAATGMYGLFKETDRLPSFSVDFEEFEAALQLREKSDLELEAYVNQLQSPKLILSYEELLKNQDVFLQRVFSFLEVEIRPVTGKTLKITSDDLRDVIDNFDDLRARYRGTQYEPMFDEVIIN